MVLTLHHLDNSRSQRIVWLLEELDVPYELKLYQRDPKDFTAQQDLKDLHPLQSAPVLIDGDVTVVESGRSHAARLTDHAACAGPIQRSAHPESLEHADLTL